MVAFADLWGGDLAISLFDILNNISNSEEDILISDEAEKVYNKFFINRGLSMGLDTVLFANDMNKLPHLDKKLHYDFLRHSLTKKKRFNKWAKSKKDETIEMLKGYYQTTWEKASEIYTVLSDHQINEIKETIDSKRGIR